MTSTYKRYPSRPKSSTVWRRLAARPWRGGRSRSPRAGDHGRRRQDLWDLARRVAEAEILWRRVVRAGMMSIRPRIIVDVSPRELKNRVPAQGPRPASRGRRKTHSDSAEHRRALGPRACGESIAGEGHHPHAPRLELARPITEAQHQKPPDRRRRRRSGHGPRAPARLPGEDGDEGRNGHFPSSIASNASSGGRCRAASARSRSSTR
jgi:hypothetical protein